MALLLRLRVVLTLLVAVILPLESSHCALMPMMAAAAGANTEHHDEGDHDCCPEPAPSHDPISPADPSCCGHVQLPALTANASLSVGPPQVISALHAVARSSGLAVGAQGASGRIEPEARSGSPPESSTAQQSPRGPPHSA